KIAFGLDINNDEQKGIDWIGNYLLGKEKLHIFNKKLKEAKIYSSAPYWIDDMLKYDLVIGMRIHGAIAAIQAGKLGVCVAFDSRTLELCQTMGYPYIDANDLTRPDMQLSELVHLIKF